jgi:hypothetical protein
MTIGPIAARPRRAVVKTLTRPRSCRREQGRHGERPQPPPLIDSRRFASDVKSCGIVAARTARPRCTTMNLDGARKHPNTGSDARP